MWAIVGECKACKRGFPTLLPDAVGWEWVAIANWYGPLWMVLDEDDDMPSFCGDCIGLPEQPADSLTDRAAPKPVR